MPSFIDGLFTTGKEQGTCQVVPHIEEAELTIEIITN
jgi:hypothetical protein